MDGFWESECIPDAIYCRNQAPISLRFLIQLFFPFCSGCFLHSLAAFEYDEILKRNQPSKDAARPSIGQSQRGSVHAAFKLATQNFESMYGQSLDIQEKYSSSSKVGEPSVG
jgi:hypothetical protein